MIRRRIRFDAQRRIRFSAPSVIEADGTMHRSGTKKRRTVHAAADKRTVSARHQTTDAAGGAEKRAGANSFERAPAI
jgi:hypothetical protein